MSDEDDRFRQLMGSFGQYEATVGTEAYQSMVELNQTASEHNRKQTELVQSQIDANRDGVEHMGKYIEAKTALIGALTVWLICLAGIAVLVAIPYVVMLWRSAL